MEKIHQSTSMSEFMPAFLQATGESWPEWQEKACVTGSPIEKIYRLDKIMVIVKYPTNSIFLLDYFDMEGLSNSFLGWVKAQLLNRPYHLAKPETLDFGSDFHTAVLEEEKYNPENVGVKEHNIIMSMKGSLHKNSYFRHLMKGCKKEVEKYFTYNGLPAKMKIDMLGDSVVADLKSTTCKTLKEFEQSIIDYDYHRQGAWYLDNTGRLTFVFFGVQKMAPFNVFMVIYDKEHPLIDRGRVEYKYLINEGIKRGIIQPGYRIPQQVA